MKTIYLIMGQRGDHDEFAEFPIVTATTEERANRLVELLNDLSDELKLEIDALPLPTLESWTDPDKYQEYVEKIKAREDQVLEINTKYASLLPAGVNNFSYGTNYILETITLIEE